MPNNHLDIGVDLLPVTTNTYNLGNSEKKWNLYGNLKSDNIIPIISKDYPAYTCSADSQAKAVLFFGKINITNSSPWQTPWSIHYRVYVSTTENNTQGWYDCNFSVLGSTVMYYNYNNFYSTDYRPIYHHSLLFPKSGYSSYGGFFGVRVQTSRTVTSLARTFKIELIETKNCTVDIFDSIKRFDETYITTNSVAASTIWNYGEYTGTAQGLYESGDSNDGCYYVRYWTLKAESAITGGNIIVGTSAGYKHLKLGTAFDLSYPPLYAGGNISAGSTSNNNYLFHYAIGTGTTQSGNFTAYLPIYIKGTISGNTFTPVSTTPLTQTLSNSDDGYVYYYIGRAYAATSMTFDATAQKILWYKDGSIQEWAGASAYAINAGNAATATTATNLANNPSIQTSGTTQITITAGGKTSSAYTVPYATSAGSVAWANTGHPDTFPPSSHTHDKLKASADARSTATTPNTYNVTYGQLIFHGLKGKATINNPSSDTYSYLIGLRGWSDSSGGDSHELAFNNSGINWRHGATTTWGDWYKILTSENTTSPSSVPTLAWNTESTVFTLNGTEVKIKAMAKPTYTYSDVGAAPSSTVSCTTANVKSALGTVSTTAKKFLKDTGGWAQVDWGDLTGVPSTFSPSSHTHPVSQLTWSGGVNLTTSATANNQEWSIDLTPGSYTGTYWQVWSGVTNKTGTILACYPDDKHIAMPGNIASTSTATGTLQVTGGIGVTGQVTALRLAVNGSNTNYSLYVNGTSYLNGTTYANGSYVSYAGTSLISSMQSSVHAAIRYDTRAGTSGIGSGQWTYESPAATGQGYIYFQTINHGRKYETAGDTSSNIIQNSYYRTQFFFRQYSSTSNSITKLNYYEDYYLPVTNADRTDSASYAILTSKNTVSIAQGGTGKTTAADAWTALGGGASGKHADDYYALKSHGTHVSSDNVVLFSKISSGISSNSGAAETKTYWANNTYIPKNSIKMVYNTAGVEYTLLFSNNNNNYGSVLKWGYADKYIRILRYNYSAGTQEDKWYSADWEKISAGYADSAGNITGILALANLTKGDANTALMGKGSSTAPAYVSVSPSISITAGTADNAPKVNLTVLGVSGTTAQELTKATTGVYGATKLYDGVDSTSTTLAATANAVKTAYDKANGLLAAADAMVFKGTLGTGGTITAVPTGASGKEYQAGYTYKIITAGTWAGHVCEVGDLLIAITDSTSGQTVVNNAHWTVVQTNIDGAVTGPAAVNSGRDNSIARFNGETGKIIQDSLITIDDNGHMSFGAEKVINFRMNRKKADGGGWDCPYINWYDNTNTQFARIGVYGQQNDLSYMYLGAESYSSTKNLKILPSGRIRVLSLDFNGTENYGGETQPIYWKNGVPVACTTYANAIVAAAGKATNDSDGNEIKSTYLKKSGGTMSGQIKTSFQSSIALGSYGSTQTTIEGLIGEVKLSSGCMGSANIGTAYTLNNVTIPTGWYNFEYIPHRSGGVDGAASGDNCQYGVLHLHRMNASEYQDYVVSFSSNAIKAVYVVSRFYSTITDGQVLISDGTLGRIKTSGYTIAKSVPSDAKFTDTTSFTITANATDGYWDLTGTNGTNAVTYALAPYSSKQSGANFYTGTDNPDGTTRLNYNGYLYATKYISSLSPGSWIDGQRYVKGAYNILDYSNKDSYNPWIRATNTWASGASNAKQGRWFSFGTLGTSFYWMGSNSTRTENSYDYALCYDTSNGYLYASMFSGSGTNITLGTASRAVITDSNKKLAVSSVTSTELGYVSGVTSAIQTQLNGKMSSSTVVNTVKQTAKTDNVKYKLLACANSSPTSGTNYEAVYDAKVYVNPSLNQIAAGQLTVHDKAATPVEKVTLQWNSTDLSLDFIFI